MKVGGRRKADDPVRAGVRRTRGRRRDQAARAARVRGRPALGRLTRSKGQSRPFGARVARGPLASYSSASKLSLDERWIAPLLGSSYVDVATGFQSRSGSGPRALGVGLSISTRIRASGPDLDLARGEQRGRRSSAGGPLTRRSRRSREDEQEPTARMHDDVGERVGDPVPGRSGRAACGRRGSGETRRVAAGADVRPRPRTTVARQRGRASMNCRVSGFRRGLRSWSTTLGRRAPMMARSSASVVIARGEPIEFKATDRGSPERARASGRRLVRL